MLLQGRLGCSAPGEGSTFAHPAPRAPIVSPVSPRAPSVLLHRLRIETRPQHDRLERHPRLSPLTTDALTRDAYAALLARLYAFYAPLEGRLARHDAALGFADRRAKTAQLTLDLEALGRPLPDVDCPSLPDVASAARALGCHYVLEGATLGGAVIRRHIARSIGVSGEEGGAFYTGYGAATGARWRAFCERIEAYDEGRWRPGDAPAAPDEVVDAARDTFEAMYRWLSEPVPSTVLTSA